MGRAGHHTGLERENVRPVDCPGGALISAFQAPLNRSGRSALSNHRSPPRWPGPVYDRTRDDGINRAWIRGLADRNAGVELIPPSP